MRWEGHGVNPWAKWRDTKVLGCLAWLWLRQGWYWLWHRGPSTMVAGRASRQIQFPPGWDQALADDWEEGGQVWVREGRGMGYSFAQQVWAEAPSL